MRKISILSLLVLFSLSFGQTYQFDFLTKYASTNSKNKTTKETVTYNNSDDFSYYLKLRKTEDDLNATLYDYKKSLAHNFSVQETKVNGAIRFEFNYLNTAKLQTSTSPKNYRYEFAEISANTPKVVSLKVYQSKRAKNPAAVQILTLEKFNKNLIPLYHSEFTHLYDKNDNVSNLGNYIVSKAVEKYKNFTCEVVLKEHKNVDLQITLPNKLKL